MSCPGKKGDMLRRTHANNMTSAVLFCSARCIIHPPEHADGDRSEGVGEEDRESGAQPERRSRGRASQGLHARL